MASRTRHLAAALGSQNDYFHDKQFKGGAASRRYRKHHSRVVTRRARQHTKRETVRVVNDELG